MNNLAGFLEKFKTLIKSDADFKIAIIEVFSEAGIKIEEQDFKLRDGIIYLKINNYLKNEVFLKKEFILKKLRERITKTQIIDIR